MLRALWFGLLCLGCYGRLTVPARSVASSVGAVVGWMVMWTALTISFVFVRKVRG
jgi:hypothetical protein